MKSNKAFMTLIREVKLSEECWADLDRCTSRSSGKRGKSLERLPRWGLGNLLHRRAPPCGHVGNKLPALGEQKECYDWGS